MDLNLIICFKMNIKNEIINIDFQQEFKKTKS